MYYREIKIKYDISENLKPYGLAIIKTVIPTIMYLDNNKCYNKVLWI